jgi:hypothetical protein
MIAIDWDRLKRLQPDIEKWEQMTEWAHTDNEVAQAIYEHKGELLTYPLYDLELILTFGFDRNVIFTDGWRIIPFDMTDGNEQIYNLECKEFYVYIEIE